MSNMNTYILVLAGVGGIFALCQSLTVVSFLTFHLLKPSRPLARYKRQGVEPTYALVTGASAGIGLGVAQALAKQGFGVVLLGHRADELADSAQRLRDGGAAGVEVVVLDAQTATGDEIEKAVRSISHLQIGILVNNVGGNPISQEFGPPFRPLAEYTTDDVDAVVHTNARFMARLTALTIPLLARKNSDLDRSLILNTSSAAIEGMPFIVMYSATKAFNLGFSAALARELKLDPGTAHIDSLAIVPGDVHSQGNSEVPEKTIKWDAFGQLIVQKADGAIRRKSLWMAPYWLHDMQLWLLMSVLPEGIKTTAITDMMKEKSAAFNAVWERNRKNV